MKGLGAPLIEKKEENEDSDGKIQNKKKIDRPCRKCCSSTHNPMFHMNRLGKNNRKNLNI